MKLGRGLHRYGTPADRLEEALGAVSRRLGVEAQFFCTPTAIFIAQGGTWGQETSLVRLEPGEIHLEKLSQLDEILEAVANGRLATTTAIQEVDAVVAAPPRYRRQSTILAHTLAAGTAAHFFGGGILEILGALILGLSIGLLAAALSGRGSAEHLFEVLAATVAGCGAAVLTSGPSVFILTAAGLITLLPGLSLTVAIKELATRNLVSGSSRLAAVLLTLITLGFGIALGSRLGAFLPPLRLLPYTPTFHPGADLLFLAAAALSFTVLFRARPRDYGWILIGGTVAFYAGRGGAQWLGPELGSFLGALLLGLASNLYARWRRSPGAVLQVPGLMLLVPGSLGFRGISALLAQDTGSGVEAAFTMAIVAASLVFGLFMANVLLPPRRTL
jgi:uncharacterized membrane protein YjjP (DUF1212 family)